MSSQISTCSTKPGMSVAVNNRSGPNGTSRISAAYPDPPACQIAGRHLAALVELAVRRQVRLGHDAEHPTAVDDNCRVVDPVRVPKGAPMTRTGIRSADATTTSSTAFSTASSNASCIRMSSMEYPESVSSGKTASATCRRDRPARSAALTPRWRRGRRGPSGGYRRPHGRSPADTPSRSPCLIVARKQNGVCNSP